MHIFYSFLMIHFFRLKKMEVSESLEFTIRVLSWWVSVGPYYFPAGIEQFLQVRRLYTFPIFVSLRISFAEDNWIRLSLIIHIYHFFWCHYSDEKCRKWEEHNKYFTKKDKGPGAKKSRIPFSPRNESTHIFTSCAFLAYFGIFDFF